MILADPLAGRALARGVRRVGLGLGAAWWLASLVSILTGPVHEAWSFETIAMVALALPLLGGLRSVRALDGPVTQLQVFVLLGLAIRLVEPLVGSQPAGSVDYSPLNPVITATAALTGFVLMPRRGIPLIVVHGTVIMLERATVVGVAQAAVESIDFMVADIVIMIVIWALREGLDQRAVTTAAALDAETRALSARQRAVVRQRLDGLVHDKVLGALLLGSRGEAEEAAALARDALTSLEPGGGADSAGLDSLRVISDHAQLLGLDLRLVGSHWPVGPEGDALRAATCEALTNVHRHSGVTRADVRGAREGDRFVVEIVDDGAGFDVTAIPGDRWGIKDRILGSVTAAGGRAEIISRPGRGTRIVMSCPDTREDPRRTPSWRRRTMVWAIPLAVVSLSAHMVIGTLHLSEVVLPQVVWASFVVLPVLGVLAVVTPARGARWYALLAASVLTWAVLLTNVRDPWISDWRTWFIGSLSALATIVAWRRGAIQGLIVIVGGTGLGIAGLELRGETSWTPVVMATIQGLVYAPVAGWTRSVIDRTRSGVADQLRIAQHAAVESALSASMEEQITVRRALMERDVIPLLGELASGVPLDDTVRARCRDAEASTRDQLVAPGLLSPELVADIAEARARGCRVRVSGTVVAGADLDALRAAASALLGAAAPGDRVTVRAVAEQGRLQGTAVLVGPGVAARALPALPDEAGLVHVGDDPDSVLVQVGSAVPEDALR